MGRERSFKLCNKRNLKQKVETVKTKRFYKGFKLKRLWVWPVWDIKFVRSGLYGEDRDENYFMIICIF